MEMQGGLITLGLPNPCLKIVPCTILLLCSTGYVSYMFLSLGAPGQGEEGQMVGGYSRSSCSLNKVGCLAAFMGASRPQNCLHAPPKPNKLGGKVEKAMKGRNMSHWSLKL